MYCIKKSYTKLANGLDLLNKMETGGIKKKSIDQLKKKKPLILSFYRRNNVVNKVTFCCGIKLNQNFKKCYCMDGPSFLLWNKEKNIDFIILPEKRGYILKLFFILKNNENKKNKKNMFDL